MARQLHLGLLGSMPLSSAAEARGLFELMARYCPAIVPEYYGNSEPLLKSFDATGMEAFVADWERSIYWKRRRPKVSGSAHRPYVQERVHTWINISVEAARRDVYELIDFMVKASRYLRCDFAHLHFVIDRDMPLLAVTGTGARVGRRLESICMSVTTHKLRKFIPDLYWGTIFGPAYVRHFGKERLLGAPAHIVKDLSEEHVYMQLSDSPFDRETDFQAVDAVRRSVISYLDRDSFFDPDLPMDHAYSVPQLVLPVLREEE